jgi:hypothetical protein
MRVLLSIWTWLSSLIIALVFGTLKFAYREVRVVYGWWRRSGVISVVVTLVIMGMYYVLVPHKGWRAKVPIVLLIAIAQITLWGVNLGSRLGLRSNPSAAGD